MIDLIKKTVLAGIGATVVTKEKIEAAMQGLVEQGKVTAKEASEVASRLAEDGRKEFESTRDDLGRRINDLMQRANFASKSQLDALELRVRELEARLAPPPTPVVAASATVVESVPPPPPSAG